MGLWKRKSFGMAVNLQTPLEDEIYIFGSEVEGASALCHKPVGQKTVKKFWPLWRMI